MESALSHRKTVIDCSLCQKPEHGGAKYVQGYRATVDTLKNIFVSIDAGPRAFDVSPVCAASVCPFLLVATSLPRWWLNSLLSHSPNVSANSWKEALATITQVKITPINLWITLFKEHQILHWSAARKDPNQNGFPRIRFVSNNIQKCNDCRAHCHCEKQTYFFLLLACPVFWPTPQIQSFFSFLGAP